MSSHNLQPKQADLVKVIERENVISYKKKPGSQGKGKDLMKSQNHQQQDSISAQSLQSGVYSQDVSRLKGKGNPLPQLSKQKKRFISKNLLTQQLRINNFQEKEVRQHDNLMLKQKNNFLVSENMKLKTKVSTLEKQNIKLQKILEEQPMKSKTPGLNLGGGGKQRFRQNDNLSTKILMKNLKKQLQEVKKENNNIKSSIKFTTITQLQFERDAILDQTNRLRMMLQEEQTRRISMKVNQHGISHLQQRINSLQDKNTILMRENHQLNIKIKKLEENTTKAGKASENEKNLNKMLFNVRRSLKDKQKQVDQLKQKLKTSAANIESLNNLTSEKSINAQVQNNNRRQSVQKSTTHNKAFDKRIVSKSAQKSKPLIDSDKSVGGSKCENCQKLKAENQSLKKKIQEIEQQILNANPLIIPTQPVDAPTEQQVKTVARFIEYRFKAHHLTIQESQKYLLNSENVTQEQLKKELTLEQFIETVITEPFVILNKRYIEVFLMKLCYNKQLQKHPKSKIKLDKDLVIKKKDVLENFRKFIPPFEILSHTKQEQMFLQIAQLVTSYNEHMMAALNNRKNGQGTINEKSFNEFFTQIQLEKEYIDFIITQIILESADLEKLNFYTFFEIFQMPQQQIDAIQKQQQGQAGLMPVDKKNKFQVDHVVKEEDEQYEESRSYMDNSRQKTLSKKQQSFQNEDINNALYEETDESPQKIKVQENIPQKTTQQKKDPKSKKIKEEQYQEAFEQEKMNQDLEEEKKNQDPQKLIQKPYEIEDIADEYDQQFEN